MQYLSLLFRQEFSMIIVGENSRINESLLANPTKYDGNNGFVIFNAVCILTTPPTKKEIMKQFQASLDLLFNF